MDGQFGDSGRQIIVNDLNCNGNETSLSNCSVVFSTVDCLGEKAGIVCQGMMIITNEN